MIRTIEAVIDAEGSVRLLEPVRTEGPRRVLVTILDEEPAPSSVETARLAERALAVDWNRPEEDETWPQLDWTDNFRTNLRTAMIHRDTKFADLAGKLKIARPALSRLVNGHQDATITHAGRIAAALSIPLPRLLGPPAEFERWVAGGAIIGQAPHQPH